tara:strand:- start:786 stop:1385 length:600 start_codon:yes stop_codon:yes gene_type:complete
MNKLKAQILISFLSVLFSETKEYLDLGIIINQFPEKKYSNRVNIDYMLSSDNSYIIKEDVAEKTFVLPIKNIYKKNVNQSSEPSAYDIKNIALLYFSENYTSTIACIEEDINAPKMVESNILFIADVLYRMGEYKRSLKVLDNVPNKMINDEYLMLKGLLYKELGDKKSQKEVFNTLVQRFPKSDYFTIAKLQYKMLSR